MLGVLAVFDVWITPEFSKFWVWCTTTSIIVLVQLHQGHCMWNEVDGLISFSVISSLRFVTFDPFINVMFILEDRVFKVRKRWLLSLRWPQFFCCINIFSNKDIRWFSLFGRNCLICILFMAFITLMAPILQVSNLLRSIFLSSCECISLYIHQRVRDLAGRIESALNVRWDIIFAIVPFAVFWRKGTSLKRFWDLPVGIQFVKPIMTFLNLQMRISRKIFDHLIRACRCRRRKPVAYFDTWILM